MKTPATLDPSSRWDLFPFPDHDIRPHSVSELRGVTGLTVGNALASTRSMVSFHSPVQNNPTVSISGTDCRLLQCTCGSEESVQSLQPLRLHSSASLPGFTAWCRFPPKFSQQWFDLNFDLSRWTTRRSASATRRTSSLPLSLPL